MIKLDNRPIGVFDSGLGGLTAVAEIKKIMPYENIIYLGDTGRVPYGTRSKDTIIKYTHQDIEFLKSHNIKAIIVACGTVSSVALPDIENDYDIEIVGVVKPTVLKAITKKPNQKIGIIGTTSTINSGSYEKMIMEISDKNNLNIKTFANDCPLFVPLVENGRFKKDDKVAKLVVEEYLEKFKREKIDTLILGCTHYPLLTDIITDYLGDDIRLINPGKETAIYISDKLDRCDSKKPSYKYFVTDDVDGFSKNAKTFLGEEIKKDTHLIDISVY